MMMMTAGMAQVKWLLVGAACCMVGPILATPNTQNRHLTVALSEPLAIFPQETVSTTSQWQAEQNWRQDNLEPNGLGQNQFANDRAIELGEDSVGRTLAEDGQLKRALRSLGLRRIQHHLAHVDGVESNDFGSGGGIFERAVGRILQQQLEDDSDHRAIETKFDKRLSPAGDGQTISLQQDTGGNGNGVQTSKHEFIYVIAPISEQVLPFQSEKFAQGYKNFVSLAGPNYKIGLQKLLTPEISATDASDNSNQQHAAQTDSQMLLLALGLEQPGESEAGINGAGMESSGSDPRLASLRQLLRDAAVRPASSAGHSGDNSVLGCRPVRASVQISRDDFDMQTGQLVRQCTGLASLNSCEGHCVSSVQPTLKSPGGFVKQCTCCSEGSFKRVQVRLNDCFLPPEVKLQQVESIGMGGNGVMSTTRRLDGYLDVVVNEPVDCKCRQCDSFI